MSPVSPLATLPGVRQKRSQMDSPRPSACVAPSIWNAAVAAPKRTLLASPPTAPSPLNFGAVKSVVSVIP
jgi:hypothetical protein